MALRIYFLAISHDARETNLSHTARLGAPCFLIRMIRSVMLRTNALVPLYCICSGVLVPVPSMPVNLLSSSRSTRAHATKSAAGNVSATSGQPQSKSILIRCHSVVSGAAEIPGNLLQCFLSSLRMSTMWPFISAVY